MPDARDTLDHAAIGDRKRIATALEKIAAYMKRLVYYVENLPPTA